MNLLNEIVGKSSLVLHHRKQLEKAMDKAVLPDKYYLTVFTHRDEVEISIHQGSKLGFHFTPTLQITECIGMTKVQSYILLQEFKALNSYGDKEC